MFYNYKLFNKIVSTTDISVPNFNDNLYAVINVFRNTVKVRILQNYDSSFDFTMYSQHQIRMKTQNETSNELLFPI